MNNSAELLWGEMRCWSLLRFKEFQMKLVLGQIVTNVITLSSIIELTSFFLFLVQAYM